MKFILAVNLDSIITAVISGCLPLDITLVTAQYI